MYFYSNFYVVSQLSPSQELDITRWKTNIAKQKLCLYCSEMVIAGLVLHQISFWSVAWDLCSPSFVSSGTSAASIYMEIHIQFVIYVSSHDATPDVAYSQPGRSWQDYIFKIEFVSRCVMIHKKCMAVLEDFCDPILQHLFKQIKAQVRHYCGLLFVRVGQYFITGLDLICVLRAQAVLVVLVQQKSSAGHGLSTLVSVL